jgi:PAS domain S-box-containing protein
VAVPSEAVEPHETAENEGERASIRLRLLLVSGAEPANAELVPGIRRVATLDEALLALGETPFDAVAVDVSTDDGATRLAAIRQRSPRTALIALTSALAPASVFDSLRDGAQECLPAAATDAVELEAVARRALDRKWLAEFLEHRVKFLEGLFQSVNPGFAVLGPEGNVLLANRSWCALAESADDALSIIRVGQETSVIPALAQCDDERVRELAIGIRLVLEARVSSVRFEVERRIDGEDRWFVLQVDPMPELAGVIVMQSDNTERKRTEDALRRSEVDYRRLLDALPHGVVVHRAGVCQWVNSEALKLLGYERPEQLLGRELASWVHHDDWAHVGAEGAAAAPGDSPHDVRVLRADGSHAVLEIRSLSVVYDGKPATLLLGRDVSEHRATTARMMEVDRMASAGLLATALGHEIKNPLAFVSANVDVALRDAQEALSRMDREPSRAFEFGVVREHLREIRGALLDARQGTRRVQSVVGDLQAFSRPEQALDAPVDVERVLAASINMVRNQIRHRARLVKNFFPVPSARGSEAQLGQVFLNLLTNAADAIEAGDAAHNRIEIDLHAKEGRVVVEVTDTGTGIAPASIDRVFDPFFTTKPVGHGVGLGLAICRNIVEGFGGTISILSEFGQGTTVRVELVEAQTQRPPVRASTISPLKPMQQALRVLVVDDEPLIGRAVARCLGRQHAVRWVASGAEALELLVPENFDVIFLDVMMPDMTGVEVYQRVRDAHPEFLGRIVFLTGGAFTTQAREFLEAVPNIQLGKPFDGQQIRDVAQQTAAAHSGARAQAR